MTFSKLLVDYVNYDDGKHEREIGRYWASEIYAIRKGYKKPEDFFKKEPIDINGARNIVGGCIDEEGMDWVLKRGDVEYKHEPVKYLKIGKEIQITVKPDFLLKDKVIIETKSPVKRIEEIPDKWKDQLELEYRAFLPEKIYLGVFRNNPTRRFDLDLFQYKPSETRYKNIIKIIKKYDESLKTIHNG